MINKFSSKFIDFNLPEIDGVYLIKEKDSDEQRDQLSDREQDLIFSIFGGIKVIMGKTNVHIEYYNNSVSKETVTISISKLKDEWFRMTYYECVLDRQLLPTPFKWIENAYFLKCDQSYGLEKALKDRCEYVKSYIIGY